MEILEQSALSETLDNIESCLRAYHSSWESDSIQVRALGQADAAYSRISLERVIEKLPEGKTLLFTIGNEPLHASVFTRGAYDFLNESYRTIGGENYIGPRESIALTSVHWISNTLERSRTAYFGNGWLEFSIDSLAKALSYGGKINIVDSNLAEAAARKI